MTVEGTGHLPCSVSNSSAPVLVTFSSMSLFQSTGFCEQANVISMSHPLCLMNKVLLTLDHITLTGAEHSVLVNVETLYHDLTNVGLTPFQ